MQHQDLSPVIGSDLARFLRALSKAFSLPEEIIILLAIALFKRNQASQYWALTLTEFVSVFKQLANQDLKVVANQIGMHPNELRRYYLGEIAPWFAETLKKPDFNHWSSNFLATIQKEYDQGLTYSEIGDHYGLSSRAVENLRQGNSQKAELIHRNGDKIWVAEVTVQSSVDVINWAIRYRFMAIGSVRVAYLSDSKVVYSFTCAPRSIPRKVLALLKQEFTFDFDLATIKGGSKKHSRSWLPVYLCGQMIKNAYAREQQKRRLE